MFEQAFKNIDDVLHKDAGCSSELDYTEQTSWLLFLKYLDALEHDKATEARLEGRKYSHIIDKPYRWESWAAPKDKSGKLDHNHALTGDDLLDFVNRQLFPYLQGFKAKATGPNTIEYKIGEIFSEIKNRIQSGYNLRDIIDPIDGLRFLSQTEKHELSHLYEAKIKNMGNAGRNGGEYYTPRPLIRAIIKVVDPKIGETIYDGAVGSGGFLCEAFDYMSHRSNKSHGTRLTTKDLTILQTKTFFGKEKKSLAYVIAIMNMILHGIEAPNIIHTNTLTENLADVQAKDQYDVVLANPPFGKKSSMTFTNEEGEQEKDDLTYNRQDFWATTSNKQLNFLQHIRSLLKTTGRAAVVLPDNVLFEGGAGEIVRKKLMETTELHTILRLPTGIFYAQGVKANVLFFDNRPASKTAATKDVWYYDYRTNIHHTLKRKPLRLEDLREFIDCYNPTNRHKRKATWHAEKNPEGRWRKFTYEELAARDKTSLDLFWLKDDSLADLDNLPEPVDLADEIIDNIEAGLLSFRTVAAALQPVCGGN